jgi:hypothetical protein
MSEFQYHDIAPVYTALGAAVFEAQHLEAGLSLLLTLLDERSTHGKQTNSAPLDSPEAPKTIGLLFREVRMKKYLTPAEKRMIQAGVKERNGLIHAYWGKQRSPALATPAGRAWIIDDLNRIATICRNAGRIVDSIIDRYLKDCGTSLHDLSNPLWETWESGNEPPPEVFH